MYRLLVSAARDIMCFVRAHDGVIVEANSAAERALGYSRAELLSLDIYRLRAAPGGPMSADLMKAATVKGVLFETELRRKDGSVFPVEISARGTTVVDGEEVYLGVVRDISERRQAELEREGFLRDLRFQSEQLAAQSEQLLAQRDTLVRQVELRAFLGAIEELIHSTLDAREMLERTVSEAVRAMGIDAAVIELSEGDTWPVRYAEGLPSGYVGRSLFGEPVVAREVVRTGQPLVVNDAEHHELLSTFACRHGIRSLLAIPLIARTQVTGVLLMVAHRTPHSFDAAELDFAQCLGASLSLALENARLYEEQRHIAETLEKNFIHPLPVVPGLELGFVSQAAFAPELIGGDFSEVLLLSDGTVALLIGDVAGKGVRAAGLAETVRSTVRALATVDPSPAFVLGKTNELFLRYDLAEPHVTAFLAVLDPRSAQAVCASAGHPAPVQIDPMSCGLLEVDPGPPLNSIPCRFGSSQVTLSPGGYLLLYTDGLTEARRGSEEFGEERLLAVAGSLRGRSAQAFAEGVRDAAVEFAGSLRDDLNMVCVRLVRTEESGEAAGEEAGLSARVHCPAPASSGTI